jgi:hypothetical protein
MDSQITPDRFAGHPITSFRVQERRSLTVHLEDAGKFDVMSDESANDEPGAGPVHAGRFDKFAQAADVCDGLNRVWRTAPQSTAAEVLAFVGRKPAPVAARDAMPFCRPVLCWTERQAASVAAALVQARIQFVFAGDGETTGTIDFLFRGADYSRAAELAQLAAKV